MSVTELPGAGSEFERTPPHDMAAEQCVLGGMMLSKDAISDVVEILRDDDFYRPAHQVVFEAIIDLYARGEPVDPVTAAAELTKRNELQRAGGAPYLHTLISSVPTAANAGYYAKIVRDHGVLRRLIEAGTRIVQIGYGVEGEVDEAVDQAQAEIYNVTENRSSEDYHSLSEVMPGALDEIEAIGSRGGAMVGVPTGFTDLDALMNGLHPGQLIVLAARPAIGKALDVNTPLPTPTGWTTMGEVRVGDELLGADGRPTRVVAATDVMYGRPCYEVEFSDGEVITADARHQWRTTSHPTRVRPVPALVHATAGGRPGLPPPPGPVAVAHRLADRQPARTSVTTTERIARTLRRPDDGRPNHAVDVAAPFRLPHAELPVDPYILGARLAADQPSGPPEDRRIPAAYLRASEEQRRSLLAGLLDVRGHVTGGGETELPLTCRPLAETVYELVVGLGHPAAMATAHAPDGSARHTVTFTADDARRPRVRHIVDVRRIPSVPVRCVEVDSADHMYLAGRSCVPTHNSTLGLDLARAASLKNGMSSVIFSLEMSRNEITMRLLSAEARVPLHTMRSGLMSDDDWTRMARRMSEVAEAPMFIDDSPNMSMMEIRAKCRRLKQRNDLKLVIIDYLQLMTSGKRVESRQVEVSEFSRSLKLLAKELEVPVVAVSQLNRGPEQRTDKKPMVSDLRESGCVTAATRIMRADTNTEVTFGELYASGARDVPVWALDERLKLVPRTMTHVFSSGRKEVFRVRLRSGKEIEATANHPFLTLDGWVPLGELTAGSRVGVPRHVPAPIAPEPMDDDEVILLAHLLGDGSFVKRQPVRYASVDEANLTAVTEAAKRRFGITAVRDDYAAARVTTLRLPAPYRLARGRRNPIAEWLDTMGLFGLRSHEKFIPDEIFALPKRQVALFLRHLWATDGSVTTNKLRQIRIYFSSTSWRMLNGIQRLLLRFNIRTRMRPVGNTVGRPQWTLDVLGGDDHRRFLEEVGVHGKRALKVEEARARLAGVDSLGRFDAIPSAVWDRVQQAILARELSPSERQLAGPVGVAVGPVARGISRRRLRRIANVLQDSDLEMLATNDIYWDEIAEIENLGTQDVYDATVIGAHNFVANGINIHNSIEQDADVVILLHREDAYEKESPRAGEADLIVAKHRNGPTATVTVAFQGHYSRFVDMAPS